MSALLLLVAAVALAQPRPSGGDTTRPGLVGAHFGDSNLRDWHRAVLLTTLEQSWNKADKHGQEWSARWQGFMIAPASGDITFHVETDKTVSVRIGDKQVVEVKTGEKRRSGAIAMDKGRSYLIEVTFINHNGVDNFLTIKWSWVGQDTVSIPASSLWHTVEQERSAGWPTEGLTPGNSRAGEANAALRKNQ